MLLCRKGEAFLLLLLLWSGACTAPKKTVSPAEHLPQLHAPLPVAATDSAKTDALLEGLLQAHSDFFYKVLLHKKDWNVQIIYTQVNRTEKGLPTLQHYYFNVDAARYFYPASTVKFPVSLLALQKLHELRAKGIDKNTSMITEAANSWQTAVYNDPTAIDGRPTIAQYIKKILMVSDNDAYNRLYEFLGQDYINTELHKKGYKDVQLLHRLQISLPEAANRQTNPVQFVDTAGNSLFSQPLQNNTTYFALRNDSLGKQYYQGNNLIGNPMNFSKKNRISLPDLHQILISLLFLKVFLLLSGLISVIQTVFLC